MTEKHSNSTENGSGNGARELDEQLEYEDRRIEAVYLFNRNPKKNIGALCQFYNVEPTTENIARLMHTTPELNGEQIGDFLSRKENEAILRQYLMQIDMKGDTVEAALRKSCSGPLYMPGEAQQIDRVVNMVSIVYCEQNPTVYSNAEVPYIICFALMMLNTDQHNPQVKRKMTEEDFIRNIKNSLPQDSIPKSDLRIMYESVKSKKFDFNKKDNDFMEGSAPKLRGWLKKKCQKWNSYWTLHYFVLLNGSMYYFSNNDTINKDHPLGNIQLTDVKVSALGTTRITISASSYKDINYVKLGKKKPKLVRGIRAIIFEAQDEKGRDKWLHRMKKTAIIVSFQNDQSIVGPIDALNETVSDVGSDHSPGKKKGPKKVINKKAQKNLKHTKTLDVMPPKNVKHTRKATQDPVAQMVIKPKKADIEKLPKSKTELELNVNQSDDDPNSESSDTCPPSKLAEENPPQVEEKKVDKKTVEQPIAKKPKAQGKNGDKVKRVKKRKEKKGKADKTVVAIVEEKPKKEPKLEEKPKEEPKVEEKPKEEPKEKPKEEPKVEEKPKEEENPEEEPKVEEKPKEEPKVEGKPKEEPKVEEKPKEEPKVEANPEEEAKVEEELKETESKDVPSKSEPTEVTLKPGEKDEKETNKEVSNETPTQRGNSTTDDSENSDDDSSDSESSDTSTSSSNSSSRDI